MAATIKIKNSSTAGAAPTSSDLVQGELAVNVTDKRLYTENSSGTIVELGTNPSVPVTFPDGSASAPSLTNSGDTNTGIFFPAADTIAFAEGGTESMRLDSSGNLGLGVTPSAWASAYKAVQIGSQGSFSAAGNLAVLSSNWYSDSSFVNKYITSNYATRYTQYNGTHYWDTAGSGTAGNTISFTQAMTLDASGNLGIGLTAPTRLLHIDGGASGTYFQMTNTASGRTNADGFQIIQDGANVELVNRENGPVIVYTNNTERARIDSSGNLLVGASSFADTSNVFRISGSTISSGSSVTTSRTRLEFNNGNGTVGSISTSGSTTTYSTSSDYRLKENIVPMTGALAKVSQLKPVTYTWKADGTSSEGFIAHELQAVVPDAVVGEKDAVNEDGSIKPQGIDTSFLVATLTAAIQEQQAIIETLTNRITALEQA